jgi:hypothetical protein
MPPASAPAIAIAGHTSQAPACAEASTLPSAAAPGPSTSASADDHAPGLRRQGDGQAGEDQWRGALQRVLPRKRVAETAEHDQPPHLEGVETGQRDGRREQQHRQRKRGGGRHQRLGQRAPLQRRGRGLGRRHAGRDGDAAHGEVPISRGSSR